MTRNTSARFALLAAVLFGAVACGEYSSPTGPSAPVNASQNLLGDLTTTVGSTLGSVVKVVTGLVSYPQGRAVTAVKWASSHPAGEQSVTGTVGYWGGTLVVPGSDFSLTFPVGALSQPTTITIVSKSGGYVAYDLLPHGLRFAKPVTAIQRFRNTDIYGTPAANTVFGAYLADSNDQIGPDGLATAVETVLSTTISRLLGVLWVPDSQMWSLNHFSRYILASG